MNQIPTQVTVPVDRLPFQTPSKKTPTKRQDECPLKLPKGWRFVIDSNEAQITHHAYRLQPFVVRKVQAPGDYTIQDDSGRGFDGLVVVERKSFSNILGEVTAGRERWEKSLARMLDVRWPAVVVETSLPELLKGGYRQTAVDPRSVVGSLIAWSFRFRVPIWLAHDRRHGELLTEWFLAKVAAEIKKESR